jgi:hypothetical protein
MVAPCAAGVLKLDIGGTQMCSIILSTSFGASAGQRWEASEKADAELIGFLERETGVEPATSSLGSWHSTTELLPLALKSAICMKEKDLRPLRASPPCLPVSTC